MGKLSSAYNLRPALAGVDEVVDTSNISRHRAPSYRLWIPATVYPLSWKSASRVVVTRNSCLAHVFNPEVAVGRRQI